jgi:hypothetical protein
MAVSNSNAYGLFISNGDFGLVKEILSSTERRNITLRKKNSDTKKIEEIVVSLAFKEVFVGFKDLDGTPHFFKARILEDLLYSEHPSLTSDESKALYLDFCIRQTHLKRGSLEFKETLRVDPYFNALRLKFGYAITCHKAQGSEWNHVFVKCKTHQSQLSADYFRWFYTAITRTSNKLYLLDPPDIKLGAGIKAVNSPNVLTNAAINQHSSTQKLGNSTHIKVSTAPLTDEPFGIPSNAHFSLEVLKRVKQLVAGSGISIQDVSQGQYLEIYFFQRENAIARVDIGYNRRGIISSLTTSKQTELSLQVIGLISPIKGALIIPSTQQSASSFEFDEDFLNDFHSRLHLLVNQKGITINNVEPMDWKQRYTFTQSDESAVFDIFYNGRNQFTRYARVKNACTSNALSSDIQTILTEGLSS